ncbi:DUF1697 domain-containing protein [Lacticaseibacillus pantheris]|uniref:DUF1697 domain-containing protein n=1 Tax=Lacticaseibacillus pantheris TaxID=171523 RepID=UPI0006CF9D1D|nr:DUF1697 domain-containing protein [Lacticaseibacillus pantheris]
MEYLALLRGINVGRNNRITMADLRAAFTSARFTNVRTYINSGNVMLTSSQPPDVVQERSQAVVREWGLNVPVSTFVARELLKVLAPAPAWWTAPAAGSISNAIFVCPPTSPDKVLAAMGAVMMRRSKAELMAPSSLLPAKPPSLWTRGGRGRPRQFQRKLPFATYRPRSNSANCWPNAFSNKMASPTLGGRHCCIQD